MYANAPDPQHFSPVPKLIYGRQWVPPTLGLISLDEGTQLDLLDNMQKIDTYAQSMLRNAWDWENDFRTPITLLFDKAETKLWCGDGHCRIKAARLVAKNSNSPQPIYVQVRTGNFREAKYYYCLTNLRYGEHSRSCRRKLIFELINDIHNFPFCDHRRLWSDREIARQIGSIDHKTIGVIRREVVEAMNPGERHYKFVKLTDQQRSYRRNTRRLVKFLSEVQDLEITQMLDMIKPGFRDKLVNGVLTYQEKINY